MISNPEFWELESEAPLLNRNNGYIEKGFKSEEAIIRAKTWLQTVEYYINNKIKNIRGGGEDDFDSLEIITNSSNNSSSSGGSSNNSSGRICTFNIDSIELIEECSDPQILRIFELDAERTFKAEKHREMLISTLKGIYYNVRDYHQGMGFVTAFLLLFLPPTDVCKIVVALDSCYVPGYFKARAFAYVRDAKVFWKIVEQSNNDVFKHMNEHLVPECFCSKWFVGMCVHVLPYESLCMFMEFFFEVGFEYLLQFGLSLTRSCKGHILYFSTDVAKWLQILRLDEDIYPNQMTLGQYQIISMGAKGHSAGRGGGGEATPREEEEAELEALLNEGENHKCFYTQIVLNAYQTDISCYDIKELRKEAMEEMSVAEEKRLERERQMGAVSDDEIVFSDED